MRKIEIILVTFGLIGAVLNLVLAIVNNTEWLGWLCASVLSLNVLTKV
jgi:hypothetical protein